MKTIRQQQEMIARIVSAGQQLSNIAFNLSQNANLHVDRDLLARLTSKWDSAVHELRKFERQQIREAARSTRKESDG